ncbi:GWT1-domain-containing protein [Collybia nuda]|uniref:GPI-anchored wall transfer protein n=1 Tax=Collybia nuda TaxID=64659 RepID=A0A9P5Y518_9AGAR|nr:GWT1-domain-containing protein [Collybia nuda]
MEDDYKQAKEAFVSDMTGSTLTHTNLISLVALFSIALYSALATRLSQSKSINFLTAWSILVLPLLLSMSIFANSPVFLSILLLIPTGFLLSLARRESGTPLPSPSSPRQSSFPPTQPQITPLPALTVYRAHMMLMTILAILAVDFPVFPRSLVKCETFGVSLMDLGVGSFVFSQGIVSAIPLLKDPAYLNAPIVPKLFSVTRKTLPIIFIGLVRVLLVKGTEYPEHVSEYGVHWNFFITLALLPVMQVSLHPLIARIPLSLLGILVAIAQQMALSYMGLYDFVLNAPRTNIISANKEGIVSLTGYLAIHLFGLSTGTLILPPSPKFFRRRQKAQARSVKRRNSDSGEDRRNSLSDPRQNDKTATELCAYAVVWWCVLGLTTLFGMGGDAISRRMVNLTYILWMVAFNTSFILGYFLLDLYFYPSSTAKKIGHPSPVKLNPPSDHTRSGMHQMTPQRHLENPPPLLEAINKNSLVLFLVANVATGLINLTFRTMYASDFTAMYVLGLYSFGLSLSAWMLRKTRLLRL